MRVLLVEDSEDDALFVLRELRRGGYETTWKRVDRPETLAAAMEEPWDLITCDWVMPGFGARQALALISDAGVDVPIIIVSGEVGEEFAVTAMKAGAQDFVSKHRLDRLVPAIKREMREAESRRARKRAEESLRGAERRFQALIESTSDLVSIIDPQGIYLYVSPSLERTCGFGKEFLVGQNAMDLVHPDDRPALIERLADGLAKGEMTGVVEYRFRRRDGTWRVIETVAQNLLDDPLVGGIVLTGRDITARREMEETLRLQSAIMANLAEGVVLSRVNDDTIVHANPKFEAMFGYEPGELLGKHVSVLNAAGAKISEEVYVEILGALECCGGWSGDVHGRKKDGTLFWCHVNISKLVHPAFDEVWVSIHTDITERKRAEVALAEEREFLATLIRTVPDLVWMKDPDGVFLTCNPAFEVLMGRSEAEIRGHDDYDLLPDPALATFFRQKDQEAIAKGRPCTNEEAVVFLGDGRRVILETVKTPMFDSSGHLLGVLGVARDVTAVREASDALQQRIALQEQLEKIAAAAPGVICSVRLRPDGTCAFPYASPGMRDLCGLDPEDLVEDASAFFSRVHPDDVAHVLETTAESGATMRPWRAEFRMRHPGKGEVWVEGHTIPKRDPDGSILWHGILIDSTERKRAEEESQRWQSVFEAAGFGLAYTSAIDNTITHANPAFASQRGYTQDDLAGRPILDIYPPEEYPNIVRMGWEVDQTGHAVWETVHQRKDGSRFPVLMDVTAIKDASGRNVSRVAYALDITDRKRAEQDLSASEHRHRSLFQNMLEGFALCRMVFEDDQPQDYVHLEVNAAFEELTGLKDVVGKNVTEAIPGIRETNPELFETYGRVTVTGKPEKFETYVPALEKWFTVSVYAAGGDCFVVVFDNITERKRALAQIEVQITALEAAANAIVITDRDGTIVWTNPAFTRLTGYPLEEAIGQNPRLLKSGLQDASFYSRLWATISAGQVWSGEIVNRRKDGSVYAEEMTITPVRSGDAITHFIGVKQDITERKRADDERRRHAEHYQAITRASIDGFWRIDAQGKVLDVNDALCRLSGYSRDELLRMSVADLEARETLDEILRHMADLLAQGGGRFETRHRRKDGSVWDVEVSALWTEESGQVVAFLRDITERRRAEEQVHELNAELEQRVARRTAEYEAANKELEAFSYSVSHDLRAPLRTVDGFSRAVLEDYGGQLPEEGRQFLEAIRNGTRHMGQLIEGLLRLSRLGRQPLNTDTLDTSKLVCEVVAELEPLRKGRAVELRIGELLPCEGDPTLLKQVWINLLTNAMKYTAKRESALVEIGCVREGPEVVYFVRDNGAGFDMRHADRLFGTFQRLHGAEFEGTGIGLAIVQRIVHRHGGRIWAEGAVGQGATFYFTVK